jgi:hypothetical protein
VAFSLESDDARGIVILRASGRGSTDEGFRALRDAFSLTAERANAPLLIDLTELDYTPEQDEAVRFAERIARLAAPAQRTALLAPAGREFGVARMVAIIAELHGAVVVAFLDRDEAIAWLRE